MQTLFLFSRRWTPGVVGVLLAAWGCGTGNGGNSADTGLSPAGTADTDSADTGAATDGETDTPTFPALPDGCRTTGNPVVLTQTGDVYSAALTPAAEGWYGAWAFDDLSDTEGRFELVVARSSSGQVDTDAPFPGYYAGEVAAATADDAVAVVWAAHASAWGHGCAAVDCPADPAFMWFVEGAPAGLLPWRLSQSGIARQVDAAAAAGGAWIAWSEAAPGTAEAAVFAVFAPSGQAPEDPVSTGAVARAWSLGAHGDRAWLWWVDLRGDLHRTTWSRTDTAVADAVVDSGVSAVAAVAGSAVPMAVYTRGADLVAAQEGDLPFVVVSGVYPDDPDAVWTGGYLAAAWSAARPLSYLPCATPACEDEIFFGLFAEDGTAVYAPVLVSHGADNPNPVTSPRIAETQGTWTVVFATLGNLRWRLDRTVVVCDPP